MRPESKQPTSNNHAQPSNFEIHCKKCGSLIFEQDFYLLTKSGRVCRKCLMPFDWWFLFL
jgi:hypothetical protein